MSESPQRLASLDVFRGITIAGMILVNSPGNQTSYALLDHAAWHGLTPTDLVFPFFVFIAGISAVLSLSKRLDAGAKRSTLLLQVLKRAAILFGLGLLLNGFPTYSWDTIRIPGVLQRIALCYAFSALFYLYSSISVQIAALLALLSGYWWLMTHVPVPGFALGDLTKEGNVAAYIDRLLLSGHLYRPEYDPEGLLSTLPAIATGLFGNLTGYWMTSRGAPARKLTGCLQSGGIFLLAGWRLGEFFPINKALWTSSYVLVTAGAALILLGFCYGIIDMKGWKGWAKPFEIFGTNAIFAYVMHVLFLKIQNRVMIPKMDGSLVNMRLYVSDRLFGWTTPESASLGYALLYTLFWWVVCWMLYRKKITVKV